MPHLILVRHAKAVDRLDADDDFERGLTARGREDAARAGAALKAAGLMPTLALVSPARRTQDTLIRMDGAIGTPTVEAPMALYHASVEMLERAILEALGRSPSVILIGHNPGVGALAHALAGRAGAGERMPTGYPTAAAAAFVLGDASLDRPELILSFDPKRGG